MLTDTPTLYDIYLRHPVVTTDSRAVPEGSIFFALSGDRFDGNAFAVAALQQGAAWAVVSDPLLQGDRFLHVPDTLAALQQLALHHRNTFSIPVLAITGSNGKTTTKEMLTVVLSSRFRVRSTVGNFNNHIGVPLTLLQLTRADEFLVCEMGANHPGEIAFLCSLARPTHGIITNIGKAHLEGFGSLEGVHRAKGELFDWLGQHGGHAFVRQDDPMLQPLGDRVANKSTFGFSGHGDLQYRFSLHTPKDGDGFILREEKAGIDIRSHMFGKYNAVNMMSACAVGLHFGIDSAEINRLLSGFTAGKNRSEKIVLHGCTVIKDAYNANPSSMENAVRAFAAEYANGWVVLGDMKELGSTSLQAHQDMARWVSEFGFERIYLVGPEFEKAVNGMPDIKQLILAPDIHSLKSQWDWSACNDKALLLKGSRSMSLELLLQ